MTMNSLAVSAISFPPSGHSVAFLNATTPFPRLAWRVHRQFFFSPLTVPIASKTLYRLCSHKSTTVNLFCSL